MVACGACGSAAVGFSECHALFADALRLIEQVSEQDRRYLFSLSSQLATAVALRGLSASAAALVHRAAVEARTVAVGIADELAGPAGTPIYALVTFLLVHPPGEAVNANA